MHSGDSVICVNQRLVVMRVFCEFPVHGIVSSPVWQWCVSGFVVHVGDYFGQLVRCSR